MKIEKITYTASLIKEILLSLLIFTSTICIIWITVTITQPKQVDEEKEWLEKTLIRMQIRSFEWDEAHRDFYYNMPSDQK